MRLSANSFTSSNQATDAESNLDFDPALANACLLSSGIDKDLALGFLVEYKKYVEFLTTIAYLKGALQRY